MLSHANKIVGSEIVSADGPVGSVEDILFDEDSWTFRYLVVDLGERRTLLSFETVTHVDESSRELRVPLSRRAVELSPDVSTQNPVSMEAELLLGKYWQWTPYWVMRLPRAVGQSIAREASLEAKQSVERKVESRLRSVSEIEGYHIEAADGDIGHLKDLIVDDSTWQIQYLVVNAGNWLFQRMVLIPWIALESISWADRSVRVSISRTEIKNSPEYNPTLPIARDYELALHDHYHRQPYWQAVNLAAETAFNVGVLGQDSKGLDVCGVVVPRKNK